MTIRARRKSFVTSSVGAVPWYDALAEDTRRLVRIEGRQDDTPEVIAKRLEIYHSETEPIVEHYRATGKLVPLHADRSVEEVWTEISDALQVVVPT